MRWGYWLIAAVGTVGIVANLAIDPQAAFPWSIPALVVFAVGGLVAARAPHNPIGWLLFVAGAVAELNFALLALATTLENVALAAWLDAINFAFNTAWVPVLAWVLLVFPDGKVPDGKWRHIRVPIIASATLGFFAALLNGGWGGDVAQANFVSPLREATAPAGDILSAVFYPLFLISFVGASLSMIVKYRRSSGDTRLQFKWLAFAAGANFVVIILLFALNDFRDVATDETWESVLVALAFAAIPAAIGVAVLKYRLYDIDLVISRSLVLAVLAGFITLVYALIVVGLGTLIGGESEGLILPIAATAIVAVAFEPVRHAAQKWANRLVFGRRATPYEVLADLTERMAHGEEGSGLLERMAGRLGDGTGAERATIWLGDPDWMRVGASWPLTDEHPPEPSLDSPHVFPVTHDGDMVGAFEVVKPRGSGISTAERRLIEDLAGSAGAVLGYQRLNDSLEAKAAELTASRIRLVEAQDRERRRLERDLHDGAQQAIVALKVKIGLARAMAAKHQAENLERLLETLSEEAQAALDEVRALAKGIYPPVLESDGLGSAISALASGAGEEVIVHCEDLRRYPRDIEAAIYFEISEAITNAVKHGSGPIEVEVVEADGELTFSVSDSGPGFDVASANGGSGLQNLRDRIDAVGGDVEISSSVGERTIVRGSVPLDVVPA